MALSSGQTKLRRLPLEKYKQTDTDIPLWEPYFALTKDSMDTVQALSNRAKNGSDLAKKNKNCRKTENRFFTKTVCLQVLNGIWEVWGCPGAWHGPYKPIPSNFAGIWSYMAWGKSIFMFFGNIGNSRHHQIPPNWSTGLQVGPRIFV